MTPRQRASTDHLASRIWFRQAARASDPRCVRVLDEALRDGVAVIIDHVGEDGEVVRRRTVEPMGFARTGGAWWLMAWCRQLDAPRWFRLDRVRGAHATRERVTDREPATVFGTPPPDAQPVRLDL
jgi:predicted DNA-binding transcriptional regulator YafY